MLISELDHLAEAEVGVLSDKTAELILTGQLRARKLSRCEAERTLQWRWRRGTLTGTLLHIGSINTHSVTWLKFVLWFCRGTIEGTGKS